MRLAWFTPDAAAPAGPADDTRLLVQALGGRHAIHLVDAARAHDFVWQQARAPYDLCVYELGGAPAHQFIPAYAVHYPGVILLRGVPRHDRALRAARLVVVPHEPVAQAIADDYPGARVRTVVPGVEPLRDAEPIVEALRWPPEGAALTRALAGFAAGRAVIVLDTAETADWPALDPRDWQPTAPLERAGLRPAREPICVAIDPRDAAHSLERARRRLAHDEALRARLGRAAEAWWRDHATVARAAARFEQILEEALAMPRTAVEADDGGAVMRRVLGEMGMPGRTI